MNNYARYHWIHSLFKQYIVFVVDCHLPDANTPWDLLVLKKSPRSEASPFGASKATHFQVKIARENGLGSFVGFSPRGGSFEMLVVSVLVQFFSPPYTPANKMHLLSQGRGGQQNLYMCLTCISQKKPQPCKTGKTISTWRISELFYILTIPEVAKVTAYLSREKLQA